MRRIVMSRRHTGDAEVIVDEEVDARRATAFRGIANFPVWSSEVFPSAAREGLICDGRPFFPRPGGVRFFIFTLDPEDGADAPPARPPGERDLVEAEATFPGLLGAMDPGDPGMHATQTVDFGVVLEGEVGLELDGVGERRLRPGDAIVQDGCRHRWHNRGSGPAKLAFVLLGCGGDS
jgi:hypothetical protein